MFCVGVCSFLLLMTIFLYQKLFPFRMCFLVKNVELSRKLRILNYSKNECRQHSNKALQNRYYQKLPLNQIRPMDIKKTICPVSQLFSFHQYG